jgi:RNA polymerase sigma factor (sigma-70 family)
VPDVRANHPSLLQVELLFHFCRLQLPGVVLGRLPFEKHLERTYELFQAKSGKPLAWDAYLENLYPLDWYLASACLDGDRQGWDSLFASRASRVDCLLVDALRARAMRLYPRDEERQESAVTEFWSHLLVADSEDSLPVLARYDGQRPLVPWLIRVFQNWHVSQLRHRTGIQALPEDDLALPLPAEENGHWHEAFCQAARECLSELTDSEFLILGLRVRYRLSQRDVAHLLGLHEGTISRQTMHLRDRLLEAIGRRLLNQGWAGEDLSGFVLNEMGSVLMDDPRLSADRMASLLADRGKKLPASLASPE